jgi:serine/threonine-protein kinase
MEAGQAVSANLRLVRPLGQGAMGSVWVADHLGLKTQVAVKFMAASVAKDPALAARFSREASAAAQIRSPHVVQVFDHGVTSEGEPFIVMELLEGEDLAARIGRLGPMSVSEVGTLLSHLGKALTKAHQLGIIHRDIKPTNIFLVEMGGDIFAKLLDFGIAKQQDSSAARLTGTREIVGTPLYMSPEQFLSLKNVDSRADLWSLAAVVYYALTGLEAFQGETLGAVYVAVERGAYAPPSQLKPELPPELDAWFVRAFARQLSDRFATARDMVEAWEEATRGTTQSLIMEASARRADERGGGSRPSTLAGTSASVARPTKWKGPLFAVALLLVLLGVGVVGALLREPGTTPDGGERASAVTAQTEASPGAAPPTTVVVAPGQPSEPPPAEPSSAAPSASGSASSSQPRATAAPRASNPAPKSTASPPTPTSPPKPKARDRGF